MSRFFGFFGDKQVDKHTCRFCGKNYLITLPSGEGQEEDACPECLAKRQFRIKGISPLQRELLDEVISLEKEDEKIIPTAENLLRRERTRNITWGEGDQLESLAKILLKNERKRKKLIKKVLKLQRKKK